jgi:hypothetical protein
MERRLKKIIKETLDLDNLDDLWINMPKGEREELEREYEGGHLSFEEFASLTPWLWEHKEIKEACDAYDAMRRRETALDIFKESIFSNVRKSGGTLSGIEGAAKSLSMKLGVDFDLAVIELARLVKKRLRYAIKKL